MAHMANGFIQNMRGARRIELFAALALAALLALLLMRSGGMDRNEEKTELEMRLERVLARIDGTGDISVMVTQAEDDSVLGVLVIAKGMENVRTYLCVQRAVLALLDVEVSRIEIIGRDGEFGGAT